MVVVGNVAITLYALTCKATEEVDTTVVVEK